MSRDAFRESFFLECEDLLEVLDEGLNDISDGAGEDEAINAVFRAVHSIKGGAGAFALEELVEVAHLVETVLDDVRAGSLGLDRDLIALFQRSSDALADLVVAARSGMPVDREAIGKICGELSAFAGEAAEEEEFVPVTLDLDLDLGTGAGLGTVLDLEATELPATKQEFEIRIYPSREFYARGNEITLLLRALSELGDTETTCDATDLPLLGEFDPEDGFSRWSARLKTQALESDVAEIFEFAAEDCQLSINQVEDTQEADLKDLPYLSECQIREALGDGPAAEADEVGLSDGDDAVPSEGAGHAAGHLDVRPGVANAAAAAPSASGPATQASDRPAEQPKATIRVDLDRVDQLLNLVGELVVNQAMIAQTLSEGETASASEIKDGLSAFRRLTHDIQESVIAIRAQPVKPLFQRMSRIVREAALATDKRVKLITDGADTEIDTSVVERLADPLTHMIRNAVDHGLERPDVRADAGKPGEGIVHLSAAHRSGRVLIAISDDGAGIDRERVRQRAIDRGLIDESASLTDSEIDNLLFLPGVSTAKEVSNLSGRGVGMDIVRKSIQSLGGRISITSTPGKGTALTISLPLTLAVLDGIVVTIAGEIFVAPLSSVVETLRPEPDDVFQLDPASRVLYVRGQVIPIVDTGHELGLRDRVERLHEKVALVIGNEDGTRTALIIDTVEDQRRVVIKGLEKNCGEVPGIAAATMLGDGRVGLILDVDILTEASSAVAVRSGKMALAG